MIELIDGIISELRIIQGELIILRLNENKSESNDRLQNLLGKFEAYNKVLKMLGFPYENSEK